MYSLENIWSEYTLPDLNKKKEASQKTGSKFDDMFVQSSITFDRAPLVIFVGDIKIRQKIDCYSELPGLYYTPEETKIMENLFMEMKKNNPNFYDGDQMVITDLVLDTHRNVIYMEAKRVKFIFIRALSLGKFNPSSDLYKKRFYKTGVLAPFITRDSYTFFIKRRADNLYSAAAGFLEPIKDRINFDEEDLVVKTAEHELLEEFLGRYQKGDLIPLVKFSKPRITSVSFRKGGTIGTIEFIAPCELDACKEAIAHLIKNNRAKDANEHLTDYMMIPLEAERRSEAMQVIGQGVGTYNGGFLYHPMLFDTADFANPLSMIKASAIPNTRSTRMFASSFWDTITPHWTIKKDSEIKYEYCK